MQGKQKKGMYKDEEKKEVKTSKKMVKRTNKRKMKI